MRDTGDLFEARAQEHLEQAGLVLVERNYATRFGELDLIMRDGNTLVFVEVRFRRLNSHGDAIASITERKQARLIRTAKGYLFNHPEYERWECRFDVVAFDGCDSNRTCHWEQAAFEAF